MGWRRSREARILRVRSNGMSDGNGSLALFLHQELSRPTPCYASLDAGGEARPLHRHLPAQPRARLLHFGIAEVLHLCGNKVRGQGGDYGKDLAIRHQCHSLDFPVMIVHKPHMGEERGKTVPTRKMLGVEQQPVQLAVLSEVSVDRLRERSKICRIQRVAGHKLQNALHRVQVKFEH